jgi:hypothetical protein
VTSPARRNFDAQDLTIAFAVSLLAQFGFVALFSMPSPKLIEVEMSNENSRPIAVAITPVLKLGSKTPSALPSPWQRKRPVAAKSQAALPSPHAEKTPEAIPTTHVSDASVAPKAVDAGPTEQPNLTAPAETKSVAAASSTEGSEQGSEKGTETDPLKARAADMYREQLRSWFAARFHVRGKVPFDKLKTLHAQVSVTVTPDRKVAGFSLNRPSGDPTFDAEVNATLSQVQSSGIELPAPPPMYPDILHGTLPVGFACTVQKLCE